MHRLPILTRPNHKHIPDTKSAYQRKTAEAGRIYTPLLQLVQFYVFEFLGVPENKSMLESNQDNISGAVQVSRLGYPKEKDSKKDSASPRSKSVREEFFALNIKKAGPQSLF